MQYRRDRTPGATYFFTVVTADRRPLFRRPDAVAVLRAAFREEMRVRPFSIFAIAVLPDHLHAIWSLPEGDSDYSTRWRRIEGRFTAALPENLRGEAVPSRERKGERTVWQRRFWEHRIRDDADLAAHADYIHINPVKHGLADEPGDWPYSSFGRFLREGVYGPDWYGGAADLVTPEAEAS